jgi:hypothetical protein
MFTWAGPLFHRDHGPSHDATAAHVK